MLVNMQEFCNNANTCLIYYKASKICKTSTNI